PRVRYRVPCHGRSSRSHGTNTRRSPYHARLLHPVSSRCRVTRLTRESPHMNRLRCGMLSAARHLSPEQEQFARAFAHALSHATDVAAADPQTRLPARDAHTQRAHHGSPCLSGARAATRHESAHAASSRTPHGSCPGVHVAYEYAPSVVASVPFSVR